MKRNFQYKVGFTNCLVKLIDVVVQDDEFVAKLQYNDNAESIKYHDLKDFCDQAVDFIDYDFLEQNGEVLETALEGTCILFEYNNEQYVVLSDDTVITRQEDNKMGSDEAIFPYS